MDAEEQAPRRRPNRRGTVVVAVVVAAVLVLAAILVIPRLFGPSLVDSVDVVDIPNEPTESWTFDWMRDNDREFVNAAPETLPIGDARALVWARFDYPGFLEASGASGWFPGYDEQYDLGYDAGKIYAADVDSYNADTYPYTIPTPHESDYFPPGAYDNFIEYRGFHDGFGDAKATSPAGTSRREAPAEPKFTPLVSAVDSTNGTAVWTVNLADVVDGVDYSSWFYGLDIVGSNAVALFISTYSGAAPTYSVLTLDRSTGSVLSQLQTDGEATGVALDGDLVLTFADADGESSRVARYSPDDLAHDPKWVTEVEAYATVTAAQGFVMVQGVEHGTVLNGDRGSKAGWGQDITLTTGYVFVGSQLLRVEASGVDGSYTVQGWTTKGTTSWNEPITVSYFDLVDTGLFSSATADGGYSQLQRVDPATGAGLWKSSSSETFDAVLGVQGATLLLGHGNEVIAVDLTSGKKKFTEITGPVTTIYEGAALYYVPAEGGLSAHRYDKQGEVWSIDLGAGTAIVVGGRLALVNADEGTISGLAG